MLRDERGKAMTARAPHDAGLRVLVVDDNEDGAELISVFLELQGQTVRVALTGREAIDAAPAFRPDVALVDVEMPGMSGFQVLRELRALAGCESIPIIAVTGHASPADRRAALAAGFTEHVAKPVDGARLLDLIGKASKARVLV
jgi:CheY-like chemotaxis protein